MVDDTSTKVEPNVPIAKTPTEPLPEPIVTQQTATPQTISASDTDASFVLDQVLQTPKVTVIPKETQKVQDPPHDIPQSFSPKPRRKNSAGILIGLILFLSIVATGAYFVAKPGNLADTRGKAAYDSSSCPAGTALSCASPAVTICYNFADTCTQLFPSKSIGPSEQCSGGNACQTNCGCCPAGSVVSCESGTHQYTYRSGHTNNKGKPTSPKLCDTGAFISDTGSSDCKYDGYDELIDCQYTSTCTQPCSCTPVSNSPTPTEGTSSPTPTSVSAICTNIKVYKNGVQVTPSTLLPSDIVVIAVLGTGDPTKAKFRVNGEQLAEDTDDDPNWTISTTKNASQEYTVTYTIPTGITTFLFEAETFAQGAWH